MKVPESLEGAQQGRFREKKRLNSLGGYRGNKMVVFVVYGHRKRNVMIWRENGLDDTLFFAVYLQDFGSLS